jgi:hypothetical protein
MHFDRSEFHRASELLAEYYESGHPASFSLEREIFGRVLLAVSLLHLGETRRAEDQTSTIAEI